MNQQQQSVPIPRIVATLFEQQRQIESLTAQLQAVQQQAKTASTATIDRAAIEAYIDQYFTANAHKFKGEAGKDGTNGTSGKDGAIGKAGANGIHGTDGKPGKDGKQGPKGQQGKAGESSFSVDKLSKKDIVALKKALGVEEA